MPTTLKKFLYSRKFWAFVAGLVTWFGASFEDGNFSVGEIQALVVIVGTYMGSVALEDGLSNINAPKRDNPLDKLTAEQIRTIYLDKLQQEGMERP